MIDITLELLTTLNNATFTYKPTIRDFYSSEKPTYPMITVDEVSNSTIQTLHNGEERFSRIGFKIEIYAKNKVVGGTPVSNREIVKTLGREIDEVIRTTYGLIRSTDPVTLVYSADNTVLRYVMMYSGKLDPITGYIYQ